MAILKLIKKTTKQLLKLLTKVLESIFLLLEKVIGCFSKFVSKLKWHSFLLGLFSLFATSWGFYTYYYPNVSIGFKAPLRSNNIFSSVLDVHNNGNSSIYNVNMYCVLKNLYFINDIGGIHDFTRGVTFESRYPFSVQEIITKHKFKSIDVDISEIFNIDGSDEITTYKGELTIIISYSYWNKIFTNTDTIHFRTSKMIDNNIIWLND